MMSLGRLEGFSYSKGELHCEQVPLKKIAKEVGTPTYVYSKATLSNRVQRLQKVWRGAKFEAQVYFAVKACSNIHILRLLGQEGCGADIVSGGELFRSSIAEIDPRKIVFSGVGKSEKEIVEALKARIHMFNVESLEELLSIDRLSFESGSKAQVSLRVNPNVDAKTHPHISTGLKKNKFGLSKDELQEIYRTLPRLKSAQVCGLSCHIGSQILALQPFSKAWKELVETAKKAPFDVKFLDLGGGLGVPYLGEKAIELEDYAELIAKTFKGSPYEIGIEPGRALVGPSAMLLTKLLNVKRRGARSFYIVDAAMNDLIRPALYGATHPAFSVEQARSRALVTTDLVGPVCETADTFQTNLKLPALKSGSLLAFGNAGAYGMTMASQYNSRPRVAEVLVDGSSYKIIRRRETYANLIEHELV
ncbi:MAG: diaminopimelate decarboxylase [Bdellovibrionota bacterium]